jgi:hypothetical protein
MGPHTTVENCARKRDLKGTVARDFLVSVFFMDLLYIGPRFRGKKDFLFSFVFAKLFEYFDESTLQATAGIQN